MCEENLTLVSYLWKIPGVHVKLDQVSQGLIQTPIESLQGQDIHHISRQPVPVLQEIIAAYTVHRQWKEGLK